MGLNWAEGLKQAGEGVQGMAGIKMQEADYLYKEMAQQNRQRFDMDKQKDQQEFLSGMQDDRLEVQKESQRISEENAQRRHEQVMAQFEESTRRFEATYQQAEDRNDVLRSESESRTAGRQASTIHEQQKIDQDYLDELRKKLPGEFSTMGPEEKQQAQMAYDFAEEMTKIKPVNGDLEGMYLKRDKYEAVYNWIADEGLQTPEQAKVARAAARAFAVAPEGAQAKMIEYRDEYLQKGMGRGRALTESVNRWRSQGSSESSLDTGGTENPPPAEPKAKQMEEGKKDDFIPEDRGSVGYGKPHPNYKGKKEEPMSEVEEEAKKIAQEMGVWDDSVASWLGGGIPPKHRKKIYAEAEKRVREKQQNQPRYAGAGSGLPTGGAIGGASK